MQESESGAEGGNGIELALDAVMMGVQQLTERYAADM